MLVRTTSYSLPTNLHTHVEVVQPTTMFGRFKPEKSTIFSFDAVTELLDTASEALPFVLGDASGVTVDPSCNKTITVSCLLQLYNAVGYVPSNDPKNSIGITGYLVGLPDFKVFISELRHLCFSRTNLPTSKTSRHFMLSKDRMRLIRRLRSNLLLVSASTCFRSMRETDYIT
jgi:hypothetical protein